MKSTGKERKSNGSPPKKFPLPLQCVLVEFGRMDISNRGSMHDDAWIYNSLDAPVELSCASIHLEDPKTNLTGEGPELDMEQRPFLTFYIQYTDPFA